MGKLAKLGYLPHTVSMTTFTTDTLVDVPEWTISDRIRKARREAGLTQLELADAIGVKTGLLGTWESTDTKPRDLVATCTKIAEATQVPVEWLLTGAGSRSRWFAPMGGLDTAA